MTDPSRLQTGASIGGKYRLEAMMAKGGMGAVWRARHVELGVPVAVKFMDGALAAPGAARVRFAREAKAAAALRHPNIVDVHDYGVDRGLPYLVMEHLVGEDLSARLARKGRLPLAETKAIVAQVARALSCAHAAGVVHRDLKPGNIFLANVHGEEVVKLLDFGVAKDTEGRFVLRDLKQGNVSLVDIDADKVVSRLEAGEAKEGTRPSNEHTLPGLAVGSPRYMSPEQLRAAKDIDGRSDLWGLGVIAFRCLTGELPFPGDMDALVRGILQGPTPSATRVTPDLPPAIDAFFDRALARDRDERFATADEMSAALSAIDAATPPAPIEAAPPASARTAPAEPQPPPEPAPPTGRPAVLPAEAPPPPDNRRRPLEASVTMPLTSARLGNVPSNWRDALDRSIEAAGPRRRAPTTARHDSLPAPYTKPRRNWAAVVAVVVATAFGGLALAYFTGLPAGPSAPRTSEPASLPAETAAPSVPVLAATPSTTPEAASAAPSDLPAAPALPVLRPAPPPRPPAEGSAAKRPWVKRPHVPSAVQ